MDALVVQNFKFGLDTRRSEQTSVPGTLVTLQDAHVNQGGEIEKRKAFVKLGTLPTGCFGLQETPTALYTFGSIATATQQPLLDAAFGAGVITYQRLQHYIETLPGISLGGHIHPAMTGVVFSCCFSGLPFVIATFGSGDLGLVASTQVFDNAVPVRAYAAGVCWVSGTNNGDVLGAQFVDEFNSDPPPGFVATYVGTGSRVQIAPTNLTTPFAAVLSDTMGGLLTQYSYTAPIAASGGAVGTVQVWIQTTTASADTLTAITVPDVTDPTLTATINLITTPVSLKTTGAYTLGQVGQAICNAIAANTAQGYSGTFSIVTKNSTGAAVQVLQITLSEPTAQAGVMKINSKSAVFSVSAAHAYLATSNWGGASNISVSVAWANGTLSTAATPASMVVDFSQSTWTVGTTYSIILTVNNIDYAYGLNNFAGITPTVCAALTRKVNLLSGTAWAFSATEDGDFWETQDAGAGLINISDLSASASQSLTAIASYQGKVALFSPLQVQIWTADADPLKYVQTQVLENTGTTHSLGVRSLGDWDVIYPASSGFRSLRVRDSSLNAMVVDLGSPVDSLVQADNQVAAANSACSAYEPLSGRYFCFLNGKIYVLSYYPQLKIQAWSIYKPGFTAVRMAVYQARIYLLDNAGNVYLYGGASGNVYDTTQPVAELPWLDHGQPVQMKKSIGIDIACLGEWSVYATMRPYTDNLDYPNLPPGLVLVTGSPTSPNVNSDSTFPLKNLPFNDTGTHIKIIAVGAAVATAATLSSIVWRYNGVGPK